MPDQLLFCDVRDPSKFAPSAGNTEKFVAVDTYGGVRRVTTEMWAKAMDAYRPDWCASPADVVKAGEPIKQKRIKKSVDRTLRWLDECLDKTKSKPLPLFAPVVGFNNEEERVRSAVETAKRDVQGFVLNAFELENEKAKLIKATIDHLPEDKPRLAYGLSTPENILLGISNGIDLFDSSYAFQMTERGRAITFRFGTDTDKTEKTINLWQKSQAQSFEPIDPTCQCYACKTPHTKAYIHHLLNAHEMLGPLLLMSHNVYQLDQFMAAIRKSMDENRFEDDMTAFLTKYSHDSEASGEIGHEDEIDADSLGVHVKSNKRQRFL
ncbi:tRNA-guanine(15) transglycosylase-like protein [Dichotomocladium elegans]|nr:tRNA-guanine(15) transglycosylase-like protein [Dichotomocladium elegans]